MGRKQLRLLLFFLVALTVFSAFNINIVYAQSYEDFGTYSYWDPTSYLDLGTNHYNWTAVPRGVKCILYADKGASHFTNLTHQFEVNITGTPQAGYFAYIWGLSNVDNETMNDNAGCSDKVMLTLNGFAGTARFYITDCSAGNGNMTGNIPLNTNYYVTINRSGSDIEAFFRTGGHDNATIYKYITLSGATTTAFRYFYAFSSREGVLESGKTTSGRAQNYDLMEGKELTFTRYENVNVFSSSSFQKELRFSNTQTLHVFSNLTMGRELGFILYATFTIFSGVLETFETGKELTFTLSGVVNVWSSVTESFELGALDLTFTMFGAAQVWSSGGLVTEVATTLSDVEGLAALALVLALTALVIAVLIFGIS